MIRRILAFVLVAWVFGFLWFAIALPSPAGAEKTDAIVVSVGMPFLSRSLVCPSSCARASNASLVFSRNS